MSETTTTQNQRPEPPDNLPPRGKFAITAPRVFWPSAALILFFVLLGVFAPGWLGEQLTAASNGFIGSLGWYYVLIVTGFVGFSIWLALSPMGSIRLGKDDEKPEFGLRSWFAMLFAAGMGIGLVFWGVAEPLNHFASPPPGTPDNAADQARGAMDTTFLHWGLHAWAIYVVVGLAVGYTVHRRNLPVSLRWALVPIFGDRVKGWIGDVVDVTAVIGTMFGVATSLGFGVSQVGAGLEHLGLVGQVGNGLLVLLIVIISGMAAVSVVTGVEKGIRFLSNLNMVMAAVLAIAVMLLGPTLFILSDFVSQIGSYLQNLLRMSFRTFPFEGEAGATWLSGWTTYYWGWWMSWAPFVGVFIARISRGRTVREFITGVLLVPTLVTFLWFSIMGGSALYREMFGAGGLIDADGGVSTEGSLFQLLDGLPMGGILAVLAVFLIVVFFVTSSDSGSYVVGMLSSGGDPVPPVWNRLLWAVLSGAIAAALLLAGGLGALQTMAILVAAPFSVVMILMAVATAKALLKEHGDNLRLEARSRHRELVTEVTEAVEERLDSR